ncbi:MAG: PKD domain-containing protein [Anaerolineales bacterium]
MPTPRKSRFLRLLSTVVIIMLASPTLFVQVARANSAVTERVSISSAGIEGDRVSRTPSISADGRFIVFPSEATNLVDGDTNNAQDIFIHDWLNGTTERVSLSGQGQEANGVSDWPEISADGSTVVFSSTATNLVKETPNSIEDVFVVDLQSGAIEWVSHPASGGQADAASSQPVISGDGRFVVFVSAATNLVPGATTGLEEIYLYDRADGSLEWVSAPRLGLANDGSSGEPAISADGNWVAFSSNSSQFVPLDTRGLSDIFLWNRASNALERVSMTQTGKEADSLSNAPAISADGRFIVFWSHASNIIAGDTNDMIDIFLHDRLNGDLQRVNLSATGEQALDGPSFEPAISADGRFVVFRSDATNLVPNDDNNSRDIFVRDLQGTTTRVSVDSNARESIGHNYSPVISVDGAAIAFYSDANNLDLLRLDDNIASDVFTHGEPPTPEPTETPTPVPTDTPTAEPTETSTPVPTDTPTAIPTDTSTPEPTATPTAVPTDTPTAVPTTVTPDPTVEPTQEPTAEPSDTPTAEPTPSEEPPGESSPPTISLKQEICVKEGETIALAGSFQDPDSESWTATVDYGDGTGIHLLSLRPGKTFELRWVYGDDGDYTVTVRIADEGGAVGTIDLLVHVKNQTPRLESNLAPDLNSYRAQTGDSREGEMAGKIGKWFTATAGEPTIFSIDVQDPGSDDLMIRWSFGDEMTYFNEGDKADPFPSPWGTYPFLVTHTASVIFDKPGVRNVRVDVYDDDGGKVSMYFQVLVRGKVRCRTSLGYWIQRFMKEDNAALKGELRAHLSILSAFVSSSFGEFRPEVLNALEDFVLNDMDQSARARAQLLAAWLNFTNGSVGWDDVIHEADGEHDLPYAEVLRQILAILADGKAAPEELSHAIELAQSINLHHQNGAACPVFEE